MGVKSVQKGARASQMAQVAQQEQEAREAKMPLGRRNYVMMLIGLGVIIIGFVLMSGGGSDDPAEFSTKMFSFRRITLAPILVIAGFVVEIFAIMCRPENHKK
jgi:hypothetical protein